MDLRPRRKGEISPIEAARIVGVARSTMYRWCIWATTKSQLSPLDGIVRRDGTGHYWIERFPLEVPDE